MQFKIFNCNWGQTLTVDAGEELETQHPKLLLSGLANAVKLPTKLTHPTALLNPNTLQEVYPTKSMNKEILSVPRIDAFFDDKTHALYVLVDIAGIAKDAIKVEIGEGLLTISGNRPLTQLGENYGEQLTIHIRERTEGQFYRQFRLPPNSLEKTACAGHSNGVLEVKIECVQTEPQHQVTIKDGRATLEEPKAAAKK